MMDDAIPGEAEDDPAVFPVRPKDWVMDASGRVAQVKNVHALDGAVYADLVIYSHAGDRLGRVSPACGGPKGFEPMCDMADWERCEPPKFPMQPRWVAGDNGRQRLIYWLDRLPSAEYRQPVRRSKSMAAVEADPLRQALQQIADGHNDPRRLAAEILGRQGG